MTRREFLATGTAAALAGAASGETASEEGQSLTGQTPLVNPLLLTGSPPPWPLAELASAGYRGLELGMSSLERPDSWRPDAERAGLVPACVSAQQELWPYLTGSLSDGVAWRRRATLDRLLKGLASMRSLGISVLIVTPSRLAENYQNPAEARELLVASLRELADAGPTQILLASSPFRLFASSGEIATVLDQADRPNVAACLNVGHAALSGESPTSAANALGTRLRYVQVNDVALLHGLARLDQHLALGRGSVSKEEVLVAIRDRPWALTVTAPGSPVEAAREALSWMGG